MNKKVVLKLVVIIVGLFTTLVIFMNWRGTYSLSAGEANLYFLNVAGVTGADAIIIESNGHYGLVDSANPYNDADASGEDNYDTLTRNTTVMHLIDYLNYLGVTNLDFVVATHSHYDHIGGMKDIASRFVSSNTKYYYRTYVTTKEDSAHPDWNNRRFYEKAVAAMQNAGAQMIEVTNSKPEFSFGDLNIKILNTEAWGPNDWAYSAYGSSSVAYGDNANSLSVLITNGKVKAFLAGDMESYDEKRIVNAIGKVDILKPGHHLYNEASSYDFLKVLQPKYVIATNNRSTRFDDGNAHMNYGAMAYLINNFGTNIYATSGNNLTFDAIKVAISDDAYAVSTSTINSSNSQNISVANINNISTLRQTSTWHKIAQDYLWVYYDEYGHYAKNTWVKSDETGYWYYVGADGVTVTGLQEINEEYYYFDESGTKTNTIMKTGWIKIDNDWYYFNKAKNGTHPEGSRVNNDWVKDNDKWYYLGSDGKMLTGTHIINDKVYVFDENGVMQTGWIADGDTWYYYGESGAMAKDEWILHNNVYYYVGSNGKMVTGWHYLDSTVDGNYWYYFNQEGIYKAKISGSSYDFNFTKGYIYTGLETNINTILSDFKYTGDSKRIVNNKLQLIQENIVIKELKIVNISSDDYVITRDYIFYGNNKNALSKNIDCAYCNLEVNGDTASVKYDNQVLATYSLIGINTNYIVKKDKIYVEGDYGDNSTILNNITSNNCVVSIENGKVIIKYNNATIKEYTISSDGKYFTIKNDYNELLNKSSIIYNIANGIYGKEFFDSFATNADVALYRGDTLVGKLDTISTGDVLKATYGVDMSAPITYRLAVRGDVLGEGKMSIAGAKKTAKHIVNGNVLKNEYLLAADVNGDGKVKMNDVVLMAKNEAIDISCSGTFQNGTSNITIKNNNNTEIVKYVINGVSYTNKQITLDDEYNSVIVKAYSKHGKKAETSCVLENNNVVDWHFSSISAYSAKKVTNNVYLHAYGDSPAIAYWIYFPDKTVRNLPLIMFIGGIGEIGNDYNNNEQNAISFGPIREVLSYGAKYNAIVVHAQVPAGYDVSEVMDDFHLLANAIANTLKADKKKISIIGFSHGCFGLMNYINSNNNYYAAAVPIGCNPTGASASAFATTQLWAFSGAGDGANTLPGFVSEVKAINGGNAWFTYVNGPHECVDMIFRNDKYGVMRWLSEDVTR